MAEFGQIGLKITIENRFLTTRHVKYLWESHTGVATLVRAKNRLTKNLSLEMSCRGSIRKFVRLFNVKNAMPEINISNFKKVNFKNFPPPSPFPRNLGSIHDTRTHTHTRDTNSNSRFPRIFSLLCTSFYSPFVSFFAHYSFLRIHSRIFKLHVQRFFIFRASVLCWINSRVQSISTLHFCCFLDSGLEINRGNRTFSIRTFHRITIPFFIGTISLLDFVTREIL